MGKVMGSMRWLVPAIWGLGTAAVVCATPTDGRYTDTAHRFSLVPPPGWTVNQQLIPHYAVLVEPTARPEDEAATIGTYGEPVHGMSLEAYIKSTRREIAKQKGLSIYGETALTLGGEKAYSWRMHVNVPGQAAHENRQVVCLRGPQALTLTLTTLPANIKKYDTLFDKVITSFRWEPGPVIMPGTSVSTSRTRKKNAPAKNTGKDAPKTTAKQPTEK